MERGVNEIRNLMWRWVGERNQATSEWGVITIEIQH